jgi:hypothetical protein
MAPEALRKKIPARRSGSEGDAKAALPSTTRPLSTIPVLS